jgi:hypothetical protein
MGFSTSIIDPVGEVLGETISKRPSSGERTEHGSSSKTAKNLSEDDHG